MCKTLKYIKKYGSEYRACYNPNDFISLIFKSRNLWMSNEWTFYEHMVQRDWGDPRKLSANNPECIHHSDIDVKYHDFNIKSQSFCRVHK